MWAFNAEMGVKNLTHLKTIYCSGVYDGNKNTLNCIWSWTNCTVQQNNQLMNTGIQFINDSRLQCFDLWEKVFTHKDQDKGGTVHMPFMLRE